MSNPDDTPVVLVGDLTNDPITGKVQRTLSNAGYNVGVVSSNLVSATITMPTPAYISNMMSEKELAEKLSKIFKEKQRAFSGEDALGLRPVVRDVGNDQNYLRLPKRRR